MNNLAGRIANQLTIRARASSMRPSLSLVGVRRNSNIRYTTTSDRDEDEQKIDREDRELDDFIGEPDPQPQSVDPTKGWGFRGVHKAIICGKVGQLPVQKILRNGHTITIFTVGTGGLFDQRIAQGNNLPKPAQWHRIVVHNDTLGTYAVQQLVKNSSVYVEGDIETRVYSDSISGEVKNIPEICIRRDGKVEVKGFCISGKIRLVKTGESISNINIDDLREALL